MILLGNLVESIKIAAMEAVEASKPCAVLYGTVKCVNPLEISIDQKITLEKEQLILTKTITASGVSAGEQVILLRMQGGQQFLVMDGLGAWT